MNRYNVSSVLNIEALKEDDVGAIIDHIMRNAARSFSDEAYHMSMLLGQVPWRYEKARRLFR